MKPYDLFVLAGRFQHIQTGHESLVDHGLQICDRGLILVGSAQESNTLRNPYDVSTRIDAIKEIYGDAVDVKPLPDLTNEHDITPDWGRYVMRYIEQYKMKMPEIMIYGNDEQRSRWFDPSDISWIEVVVPRSRVPISATQMREYLVRDDFKSWMKWVNPRLHKMYPRLRQELLNTAPYREKFEEIMRNGTPLKGWEDGKIK